MEMPITDDAKQALEAADGVQISAFAAFESARLARAGDFTAARQASASGVCAAGTLCFLVVLAVSEHRAPSHPVLYPDFIQLPSNFVSRFRL